MILTGGTAPVVAEQPADWHSQTSALLRDRISEDAEESRPTELLPAEDSHNSLVYG